MSFNRIRKFWYFRVRNGVVRKGEKGGFKWKFRRFWLDVSTLSGNFKARFTAAEHPYGYLLAGKDDRNISGYCETLYAVAMLLTTDQVFVDDIQKALNEYYARADRQARIVEDEDEERNALEFEKQVDEAVRSTPKRHRRKQDGVAGKR